MTRITFPDATTVSYRYNALGRRIEKDVNGTITRYVYDGDTILLQYDGNNDLVARYSHGDKTDQPLSLERDGQRFFFHADHLGSIRLLTSGDGTVVNAYAYDAYGRSESRLEGVSNPFTYTGRERDAESGLYYYRARYYDARIGRFLSEDPLAIASGDPNLYAYVLGNPVNLKDPSGEIVPLLVAGLVVGLINAAVEVTAQIRNPSCGRGFKDVAIAFGIGFLAGFVATGVGALAGLGAEALLAGRGLSLVAQTTIASTLDGVVAGAVQGSINTGLLNVARDRPFTDGEGTTALTMTIGAATLATAIFVTPPFQGDLQLQAGTVGSVLSGAPLAASIGTVFVPRELATVTIDSGSERAITLPFETPVPAAGLCVALISSNPAGATVPEEVCLEAGAMAVSFTITAIAAGDSVVTATVATAMLRLRVLVDRTPGVGSPLVASVLGSLFVPQETSTLAPIVGSFLIPQEPTTLAPIVGIQVERN